MAGRLTLVKSVITSQAIYLLSALRAPKEILNLIDSRRKKFLWAGCAQITGGKLAPFRKAKRVRRLGYPSFNQICKGPAYALAVARMGFIN
jgi:hypothetical protein